MDSSNILISAIEQLHSEHIVKLLSIKFKVLSKMIISCNIRKTPNILHYYGDDV